MIDGAMFLLDYSTPRCKDFSTVLSCSWFNEVQCYSDRDQMSFPYVLTRALGIQPSETVPIKKFDPPVVRDRWGNPMVLIIPVYDRLEDREKLWKGMTHWYFSTYVARSIFRLSVRFD
mmetsp:Transcript_14618/g.55266  ORF Transcript_14618/g.55266 Transcript_14618/m.55266 type:complete len:118 (-) Transcript_14618:605-958(-)